MGFSASGTPVRETTLAGGYLGKESFGAELNMGHERVRNLEQPSRGFVQSADPKM